MSDLATTYSALCLCLTRAERREVVVQYIEHPRIAKDFANYLELYKKYQARYQIDEVLEGKRNEGLMEQAAKAPFDEKLSIISLILAKLDVEFKAYAQKEDYLEVLFGQNAESVGGALPGDDFYYMP